LRPSIELLHFADLENLISQNYRCQAQAKPPGRLTDPRQCQAAGSSAKAISTVNSLLFSTTQSDQVARPAWWLGKCLRRVALLGTQIDSICQCQEPLYEVSSTAYGAHRAPFLATRPGRSAIGPPFFVYFLLMICAHLSLISSCESVVLICFELAMLAVVVERMYPEFLVSRDESYRIRMIDHLTGRLLCSGSARASEFCLIFSLAFQWATNVFNMFCAKTNRSLLGTISNKLISDSGNRTRLNKYTGRIEVYAISSLHIKCVRTYVQ
jgi:hypothetical protein